MRVLLSYTAIGLTLMACRSNENPSATSNIIPEVAPYECNGSDSSCASGRGPWGPAGDAKGHTWRDAQFENMMPR